MSILCSTAFSLDVPLKYVKIEEQPKLKLYVASVELKTTGPTYFLNFETSTSNGLACANETSVTTIDGRKCAVAEEKISFNLADSAFADVRSTTTTLTLNCFDDVPETGSLYAILQYRNDTGSLGSSSFGAAEFTGTKTWVTRTFEIGPEQRKGATGMTIDTRLTRVVPYAPTGANQSNRSGLSGSAPPGNWRLPKLLGETTIYQPVKLGSQEWLLVLDKKSKEDMQFSRAYLVQKDDAGAAEPKVMQGKVTSEQMQGYRMGNGKRIEVSYEPVDLTIQTPAGEVPYRIGFRLMCFGSDLNSITPDSISRASLTLMQQPMCYYAGEFDYNGKHYRLMLGDSDCNGSFDDVLHPMVSPYRSYGDSSLPLTGDKLCIGTSGELGYDDEQIFGKYLIIGDSIFEMKFDAKAPKLELHEYTGPTGTLSLPQAPRAIELVNNHGEAFVGLDCGATLKLPPAAYSFYSYKIEKKAEDGKLWRLMANASTDTTASVVTEGGKAELKFGEPFQPIQVAAGYSYRPMMTSSSGKTTSGSVATWFGTPKMTPMSSGGGAISMNLRIAGANGERIKGLSRETTAGLGKMSNPEVKVRYKITQPMDTATTRGEASLYSGSTYTTVNGLDTAMDYDIETTTTLGPFATEVRKARMQF